MFVHLLTGIWYEPGSKVFRLLDTLEYRWADVLRRLLAENPAERPTSLSELVTLVRQDAASVGEASLPRQSGVTAASSRPPYQSDKWRKSLFVLLLVIFAAVLCAVTLFLWSDHDDATESGAFSAFGIYEDPTK